MKTIRYPIWKSILWSLGLLVYVVGTAYLTIYRPDIPFDYRIIRTLGWWGYQDLIHGLWVALLAVAAWQLVVHRHKTAGWVMAATTVLAAMLSTLRLIILRPPSF